MGLARLEGVGSAIEVVIRTAAPDENDQLQTLLDRLAKLSGDGVALVNRTGQIEVCNRKLARLFGYELAEHLRGRSISDLVVSGILGAMAGRHGEKFTQDTVFSVDTVGVTINGSLTPIHLDILAAADEPGESINLICQVRAAKPSAEAGQENRRTAPMERSQ
jgi:PAS domain S-box-containing protein